jgi:hypothetical protein
MRGTMAWSGDEADEARDSIPNRALVGAAIVLRPDGVGELVTRRRPGEL